MAGRNYIKLEDFKQEDHNQSKIKCPVHGVTNETLGLWSGGKLHGLYCHICYCDFLKANLPPITKVWRTVKPTVKIPK